MVEIVLVMAILVIIATLAVTRFTRSYSGVYLKRGADIVRAEMGKARVRAMRTGDIYAFYYVPGSNQFTVGSFSELAEIAITPNDDNLAGAFQFFNQLLPQDIYFSGESVQMDSRAQFATDQAGSQNLNDLRPVLFYPDGTAQNAKLTLAHRNGSTILITLRGLTGNAAVSEVNDQN